MNTPNGQQEPQGQNPSQPGQQPSQAPGGQDTRGLEDDIPRQQARHGDQGGGQPAGPSPGEQVPGQGAGSAGGEQGTYTAYPPPAGGYAPQGGYYPGGARPLDYLDGAPVGFADAIRGAVNNIFTYRGRASRSAFWWFALLQAVASAIVSGISNESTAAGIVLDIVVMLPLFLIGVAVSVRRLHDSGRTGWWWWIGIVPLVGWIVLLVFYLVPGTPGPNRYNIAR
jgi:uncharacterized membrane protein YhaH (DUF805 family)